MTPSALHRRASSAQRKRVKAGSAAEGILEQSHAAMARLGIAYVRKLPTPMRIVGKSPRGLIAVHDAKSGVDYMGHYHDGRAIYVEAKHISAWSFPMSRLEDHQLAELSRAQLDGCISVLVVAIGSRDLVALPYVVVRDYVLRARHGGRKSIAREELERYRVTGPNYLAGIV